MIANLQVNQSKLRPSVLTSSALFHCKNVLPLQVDDIWQIQSGVVRSITWDEEGRVTTLGLWGKGDIVGQALSSSFPYQVECLSTVRVCKRTLNDRELRNALLRHVRKSEELIQVILRPSTPDKLLSLLYWLSYHFGVLCDRGIILPLKLTHQDLAETICSSRVTVTRLLNQFERDGKIERFSIDKQARLDQKVFQRQGLILKEPDYSAVNQKLGFAASPPHR